MLKHNYLSFTLLSSSQPPSGGCVLKHAINRYGISRIIPAAFGRLCVETISPVNPTGAVPPAAFGRLCVETPDSGLIGYPEKPAAFGRLCVETAPSTKLKSWFNVQPPSGGCVLKRRMVTMTDSS